MTLEGVLRDLNKNYQAAFQMCARSFFNIMEEMQGQVMLSLQASIQIFP